jgi:hypothetical protein
MSDLSILRENRDLARKEETRFLRTMTIQESLEQWLQLQRAFEWQLQQTAGIFEPDRRAALVELQKRLQCLVKR